jgi:hypothetical protein
MHDNERYENYITESLLPGDFEGLDRVGGVIIGVYKVSNSELRVRCIAQPDALSVPEDLVGVLAMAQEPGKPLQLDKLKNNEFLLDIDAINKSHVPQRMGKQAVLDQLDELHKLANMFFRHKDVCTEHAFNVWKGEV